MKRPIFMVSCMCLLVSLGLVACQAQPTSVPATAAPVKIIVASDATWPPFEFIDEQSKAIVGFDIDLMKAIAAKAGLEVEFQNVAWDPLLAGVAQCQYDAAISSVSITEDRQKDMLFSDPYFQVGQMITVRADNTDITGVDTLTGKTVGTQLGTTGDIEAKKMAGVTVKGYDTIDLAFQDLLNGQVDAVIADNALAIGYIGKNPDKLKQTGDLFTGENIGIAVCKNKPELVTQFNTGLAAVKAEGLIEQLTDKWLKNQ